MLNVNIEKITKAKVLVLALSLFSTNDGEPIEHQKIIMYAVNIEEMTKMKSSVLALSLFSIAEIEPTEWLETTMQISKAKCLF